MGDRTWWERRGARLSGAVVVLGVLLGACGGSDGGSVDAAASTAVDAPSAASAPVASQDSAGTTLPAGGTTTLPTPPTPASPTSPTSPGAFVGGTDPVSVGPGAFAYIHDVRVGAHEGFDRVVFEFDGPDVPGYDIGYDEFPLEGTGESVTEVEGDRALRVSLLSGTRVDLSGPSFEFTFDSDRIAGPGADRTVTEVAEIEDFEAVGVWAIGVHGKPGFVVSTLDSPARLVIDIAHG
ncbi:MAG: hypothetical protein OEY23_00025 [Acidimicrobiia bacterium]|nr:hypothetical protein [Acidimicrobiia bacterium]